MTNAKQLYNLLRGAAYTPRRYSERGMNGRACIGVVGDAWEIASTLPQSGGNLQFSITLYRDASWGVVKLGRSRYRLDIGRLAVRFEHY